MSGTYELLRQFMYVNTAEYTHLNTILDGLTAVDMSSDVEVNVINSFEITLPSHPIHKIACSSIVAKCFE